MHKQGGIFICLSVGPHINSFKPVGNLNQTGQTVRGWKGIGILQSAVQWKRASLEGISIAWNQLLWHHITSLQGETFWVSQTEWEIWSTVTDCEKFFCKTHICQTTLHSIANEGISRHEDMTEWLVFSSFPLPCFLPPTTPLSTPSHRHWMLCHQHNACNSWAEED